MIPTYAEIKTSLPLKKADIPKRGNCRNCQVCVCVLPKSKLTDVHVKRTELQSGHHISSN